MSKRCLSVIGVPSIVPAPGGRVTGDRGLIDAGNRESTAEPGGSRDVGPVRTLCSSSAEARVCKADRQSTHRRFDRAIALTPDLPNLPFLSAPLPGIGGTLKSRPEDFIVDEIPAYEPSGEGEHLFLWIQKTDVAAEDLIAQVARACGIGRRDVGMAGMKDRRAVSRQYVSVPARCEPMIGRVESERIHVLRSSRHGNKLRTGHLRGNRFQIRIRDVGANAAADAAAISDLVGRRGYPNYFGAQRFGRDGQTLALGLDLLRGASQIASIPAGRRRFLVRLALSAAQSALFNAALSERLNDVLLHTVLAGDVMERTSSGGQFVAADVETEQPRYDRRETVVTGPIFGPKMMEPTGEPAAWEARILNAHGLSGHDFERFPKLTAGTRRPFVVWPHDLKVDADSEGIVVSVTLPSGAYATTLLREFTRSAE